MKVLSIVGARPQFIKAAMLSRAMKAEGLNEVLVHTGQHFDENMSGIFLSELGLPKPSYHLELGGLSHGAATGRMLEQIEGIILKEKPDAVLVYGDTNSTLAGALAASKIHIPVGHVEGGMRSFNRRMPEELNRIITDHLAYWHFVTSHKPREWLMAEGITKNIHLVGDVMYDALLALRPRASGHVRKNLDLRNKEYILATIHRAENVDDDNRFTSILQAILQICDWATVVVPVHPRAKSRLKTGKFPDRLKLIEPVGYLDMLDLEDHSKLIMTDSGGVQKEAYFLSVPCVTLRDETEWVETLASGWNVLVGCQTDRIIKSTLQFWDQSPLQSPPPVYGDGRAADKIVKILQTPSP